MLFLVCSMLGGCSGGTAIDIKNTVSYSEVFNGDFFQLVIDKTAYKDTVEPENPSGYYHYFREDENCHYAILKGRLNNISGEILNTENISCSIELNGKKYPCIGRLQSEDRKDIVTEIAEGKELDVLFFAKVPKSTETERAKLILRYNEMFRKCEEDDPYRYELNIDPGKR